MNTNADDIRATALALPPKERAKLAHDLLQSLELEPDPDAEAAWLSEIQRRVAKLEDGTAQPVDWELARDRIRRQHGVRRLPTQSSAHSEQNRRSTIG